MHILVVEDNHSSAQAISDGIRSSGNMVLGPVASAPDARACAHDADAAILDIRLIVHTSLFGRRPRLGQR